MPRSYVRIILHTVFATKYRAPLIDPMVEQRLFNYIIHLFKETSVNVMRINGGFDHLHIVHNLPRTKSIAEIIKHVKAHSSRWMKQQGPQYRKFTWQEGYGCFSSDYRKLDGLFKYIDNQKQHHYGDDYQKVARLTFEQEYSQILNAYGLDFDWDQESPPDPDSPPSK